MNIKEALDYINSITWSKWGLGLSRTTELLRRVGDPQKSLRFVHVAGTNGKGSTCAMIDSVLRAAGYRTGIYPSPFLEAFNERIQVNGTPIPDEDLCELTEIVKNAADGMEDHPRHFEIITAIGMLYFAKMKCDIIVLEVGLGGSLDSTNVIDPPDVAVITNIGYDHTEYLGNTLAEIASNKAGIIKRGTSDVVVYPNVPEVMDVLKGACEQNGCSMRVADFSRMKVISSDLTAQHLEWNAKDGVLGIDLPLVGGYQVRNAAVALTAIEALQDKGWKIPEESIIEGMAKVSWPARFEVLGTDPVFILDGGHNLQCAEAVTASIRTYLPDTKVTFLIGILADKDYMSVIEELIPYANDCCCVTPPSDRALPGQELAEIVRGKGVPAVYFDSIPEAIRSCREGSRPVIAFGSLYMAGEIRKAYREQNEHE